MASARTHCPQCSSFRVETLDALLRGLDVDYFAAWTASGCGTWLKARTAYRIPHRNHRVRAESDPTGYTRPGVAHVTPRVSNKRLPHNPDTGLGALQISLSVTSTFYTLPLHSGASGHGRGSIAVLPRKRPTASCERRASNRRGEPEPPWLQHDVRECSPCVESDGLS
jgi:hypothetical protein